MSEHLSNSRRLTIASMARDITLHFGERMNSDDAENMFVITSWVGSDTNGDVWGVTLISRGLYSSSGYVIDLRSQTTSDYHRYKYDIVNDSFIHEYPVGTAVATGRDVIEHNMYSWLINLPTPDSIVYGNDSEIERLRQFDRIGARLAIDEAMSTPEGRCIFNSIVTTEDNDRSYELHLQFYNLTRRSESSFSSSPVVTKRELDLLVEAQKPRQLPPGNSTVNDQERSPQ
jgi:hypothetical protein